MANCKRIYGTLVLIFSSLFSDAGCNRSAGRYIRIMSNIKGKIDMMGLIQRGRCSE